MKNKTADFVIFFSWHAVVSKIIISPVNIVRFSPNPPLIIATETKPVVICLVW